MNTIVLEHGRGVFASSCPESDIVEEVVSGRLQSKPKVEKVNFYSLYASKNNQLKVTESKCYGNKGKKFQNQPTLGTFPLKSLKMITSPRGD
jgi:hypothetical protein